MAGKTGKKKRGRGADPEQPRKKLTAVKKTKKPPPFWKRLAKSRDGKELMIVCPNKDVKKALSKIGDEDPAILLDWDISALNIAAARVNAMAVGARPAIPPWITGAYPIAPEGLQQDIAADLATPGGGLHGNTLVAPNTLTEYGAICGKTTAMMTDPFVVALCAPANCRPLARIFTIADGKKSTTGESTPPPQLNLGVRAFE